MTLVEGTPGDRRRSAIQPTVSLCLSYTLDAICYSIFVCRLSIRRLVFRLVFLFTSSRQWLVQFFPRGLSDSATPTRSTPAALCVPTLYGRDQPPGVPCSVDGDGPVFYGAGMRSGVFTREGM